MWQSRRALRGAVIYRQSSVRLRLASKLIHPQGDPDPPPTPGDEPGS